MTEIKDIRERQLIALDTLKYFNAFCQANKITYMLAYGTLLGAVRHKGFIPWDDDIDIMMHRNDYNKFIALYKNSIHPRYKLMSMHTDKNYFAPLAKLCDNNTVLIQDYKLIENTELGIYIDIFIIDAIPDSKIKALIFYTNCKILRFLWGMSVRQFFAKSSTFLNFILRVPISLVCKFIGFRFFLNLYDRYSQKYNGYITQNLGVVIFGEGINRERNNRSNLYDYSTVFFEGIKFNAPKNCHSYLKQMYGNYMQIPKIEDRIQHRNIVYWKSY
jgi:lipopolysaccharide cholinephosphotransferase